MGQAKGRQMKLIIAGTRDKILSTAQIDMYLAQVMNISQVTEEVCGMATGIDTCGKLWAIHHEIPWMGFPADWSNIDVPGAVVKFKRSGVPYNVLAGYMRKEEMAQYADALAAFRWNGSGGTTHMISMALKYNLATYIFDFNNKGECFISTR